MCCLWTRKVNLIWVDDGPNGLRILFVFVLLMWVGYCHLLSNGCHHETASDLSCVLPVNKENDPHLSGWRAQWFKDLFDFGLLMWFGYCHVFSNGCHHETASDLNCVLPVNNKSGPHLSGWWAQWFKDIYCYSCVITLLAFSNVCKQRNKPDIHLALSRTNSWILMCYKHVMLQNY